MESEFSSQTQLTPRGKYRTPFTKEECFRMAELYE